MEKKKIDEIIGRHVITFFVNLSSKSDLDLTGQVFVPSYRLLTDFADEGRESLFHKLLRFTFSHQRTDVLH